MTLNKREFRTNVSYFLAILISFFSFAECKRNNLTMCSSHTQRFPFRYSHNKYAYLLILFTNQSRMAIFIKRHVVDAKISAPNKNFAKLIVFAVDDTSKAKNNYCCINLIAIVACSAARIKYCHMLYQKLLNKNKLSNFYFI